MSEKEESKKPACEDPHRGNVEVRMKKSFKVGDRVRVYGVTKCMGDDKVNCVSDRRSGLVVDYDSDDDYVRVRINGETHLAHPKQCRRLVKKARRRIWVDSDSIGILEKSGPLSSVHHASVYNYSYPTDGVPFVEVRNKK